MIAESSDPRVDFRWPNVLPDSRTVLVTRATNVTEYEIATVSLGSRDVRTVLKSAANPVLVGDYLVYTPQVSRDANRRFQGLFAVPFDTNRVALAGTPFPVLDDVQVRSGGAIELAIARNGMMVSMPALKREEQLVWVDRQGAMRPILDQPGEFWHPRVSSDGKFVAVALHGPRKAVYVHDIARRLGQRVATTNGEDFTPVWSPDGSRLASSSDGVGGITWRSLQLGGAQPQRVDVGQHLHLQSWSPDGRFIVFDAEGTDTLWDIRAVDVESREVITLVQTNESELHPAVSPDGRWLAYASTQSGRFEVYVLPFRRPGRPVRISTEGGQHPVWSREGQELFFLGGTGVFVTRVTLSPEFRVAEPQQLFSGRFSGSFDVAPGAREFAMVAVEDEGPRSPPLRVALNWVDEFRHRAAGSVKKD